MTTLTALLPLALLAALLIFILRGRRPTFHPSRANAHFRSVQGPLMATWLALVAAAWGLLELTATSWMPLTPTTVATALVATVIGLVIAPRGTLFALAVIGLGTQAAKIVAEHGLATALTLLVVTLLLTWLFGATRGLLTPRRGAGWLLLVGVVLVAATQVLLAA